MTAVIYRVHDITCLIKTKKHLTSSILALIQQSTNFVYCAVGCMYYLTLSQFSQKKFAVSCFGLFNGHVTFEIV